MVAESRDRQVNAFPWWRAALVWMLIILAETLHGLLRELFIAPQLGDLRARQLSVVTGSALIFLIAWATARWMGARSRVAQLEVGAMWIVLTVAFEFALGRAMGLGWDRILADYNPARGGFMILGMVFMFFAPLLAARLRS
jgi:hypothetical protein